MQVALGRPIASGRTAEVYAWEEGWVLKLFHKWFSAENVAYEAQVAGAVHATGLPVPAVGEVVEVNGRLGLTYERVDGPSMLQALGAKPWTLFQAAHLLAALQAQMHATSTTASLPSQTERLRRKVQAAQGLSARLKEAALQALAEMPLGELRLCHGDFHPDNIILTAQGPVVIDWIDATIGNPLADVARTSIILLGARASRGTVSWLQRVMLGWYHRAYLRSYFQLAPGWQEEWAAWRPIVAVARMDEGITEIQDWLLAQAKAGLA